MEFENVQVLSQLHCFQELQTLKCYLILFQIIQLNHYKSIAAYIKSNYCQTNNTRIYIYISVLFSQKIYQLHKFEKKDLSISNYIVFKKYIILHLFIYFLCIYYILYYLIVRNAVWVESTSLIVCTNYIIIFPNKQQVTLLLLIPNNLSNIYVHQKYLLLQEQCHSNIVSQYQTRHSKCYHRKALLFKQKLQKKYQIKTLTIIIVHNNIQNTIYTSANVFVFQANYVIIDMQFIIYSYCFSKQI
eukprot:TRINITY_DN2629_c0_g1_i2.p1 TRINITY_DN2629_c0_g1~~TRINITY_DN2629_c0_g1_i2.p1  ORF type:complete len:244 (+),score=-26.10 TRINITY_DN2629_c0_g1_i2:106-837(+)